MKKISFSAILVLMSFCCFAQNKLVTQAADTIDCQITDVSDRYVQIISPDGDLRKVDFILLSAVYYDGKWWQTAAFRDRHMTHSAEEVASFMYANPEDENRPSSLLRSAGGLLVVGNVVPLLGLGISLAMEGDGAILPAVVGGLIGLFCIISAGGMIQKAGDGLRRYENTWGAYPKEEKAP